MKDLKPVHSIILKNLLTLQAISKNACTELNSRAVNLIPWGLRSPNDFGQRIEMSRIGSSEVRLMRKSFSLGKPRRAFFWPTSVNFSDCQNPIGMSAF